MKQKDVIKNIIRYSSVFQIRSCYKYFKNNKHRFNDLNDDELFEKIQLIFNRGNKTKQIVSMMKHINIKIRKNNLFQTWIDCGLYVPKSCTMTDNVPPYYPVILDNSLTDLKNKYKMSDGVFYKNELALLKGVEKYIIRVIKEIDKILCENSNCKNLRKTRRYFSRMLDEKTASFEEALQRILFWSSMFWQSQHQLVGIGRLDKILDKYPMEDNDRVAIIKEFYKEMHRYYAFKSGPTSLGDTGQIVILGGLEEDGTYFCNQLTYDFITAIRELRLPDPKALLRVSEKMPDDLLALALECIKTGIGCPLLANDDVVIPSLVEFGYNEEDAYNYVTSACWEPLAYGKSLEKNNIKIINYAAPLTKMILSDNYDKISNFEELIDSYKKELTTYVDSILSMLQDVKWEEDPLTSLFTEACLEKGQDVSTGGAKYNDYGILSVGLSNTVNSLFNIKNLVFGNHKYTLGLIKDVIVANYAGYNEIQKELKSCGYYGTDNDLVVNTVREIIDCTEAECNKFKNKFGGKVKFGLSASNYVEAAEGTGATVDGRCNNEPLRAHITASGGITYTELINFASKLDYKGIKSNGNVVDFFVSPSFLENNFDKFLLFIKGAIKSGFFEMQMNVVSSETLIDAKKNPEKYSNLIVRVWGFSAYFKDLPEDYQNILIERALQSEGAA